jgi:excisionase family DNA binding protein
MTQTLESVRGSKSKLWDEEETAAYLNVEPRTLTAWRTTKRYNLPYIKCGRLVRYRPEDVERFLESRTVA